MPASYTPWMGTVTLALANTAYQLSALLNALSDAVRPQFASNDIPRTQHIAIQANPDNATGAKYYIGNPGLTTTHYGVMLYASQTFPIYSMEANLIRLDHIYLLCDTAGETMNLTFLTR